jgi:hypothetical protein
MPEQELWSSKYIANSQATQHREERHELKQSASVSLFRCFVMFCATVIVAMCGMWLTDNRVELRAALSKRKLEDKISAISALLPGAVPAEEVPAAPATK